jgi:RNA polymerase sigma-70 factor (ECF subfamily)
LFLNTQQTRETLQETLVKDRCLRKLAAGHRPSAWMFCIMHNTHISERRRHQVREQAKPMPKPVDTTDPTLRIELQQVLDA